MHELWKPFTPKDKDVNAKVEFFTCKKVALRANFQDSDLETFWQKAVLEYSVLSETAL
jgi:hypothetical protein